MRSKQKQFSVINVEDEVRWKFDHWQRFLEKKWDRRVTQSETLEWLLDTVGPPQEG